MTETVILDPTDADVFHTDVTCTDLWALFARAEATLDADLADPDALVTQAQADGLLVLDGVVGGMRSCRRCCRPGAAAVIGPWRAAA
jgi:hypothetical protein